MDQSWKGRVARGMAVAASAALLGACATGPRLVRTEVTNFNEWTTLPAEKTYAFARTLEYQNSLEVKSYEDIVRDELAQQGFRLVAEPAQANLLVTLRPSVFSTRVLVRDSWGYGGYGSGFGPYGGFGYGGFGGYGGYGGSYGGRFGGYDPFVSSFDTFRYPIDIAHRRLELDIDSRTVAGKRYYEGRVETSNDAPSLPAIAPYLVRALFVDFPGGNGQTRRVDVPMPRS